MLSFYFSGRHKMFGANAFTRGVSHPGTEAHGFLEIARLNIELANKRIIVGKYKNKRGYYIRAAKGKKGFIGAIGKFRRLV